MACEYDVPVGGSHIVTARDTGVHAYVDTYHADGSDLGCG